jgi:hypothetical protein
VEIINQMFAGLGIYESYSPKTGHLNK